MTADYRRQLEVAVAAAKAAAALIREEFYRPGGPRGGAGHAEVDAVAEQEIRRQLCAAFPEYGYRGEETGCARGRDAARHGWVVDPDDGTSCYLQGWRESAVSIALLRDGEPVLGVVGAPVAGVDGDDLVAWAEGLPLTRNGRPVARALFAPALTADHTVLVSAQADRNPPANAATVAPARYRAMASIAWRLALVAAGEAEMAVSLNGPIDWDYAGGHALLRGAGGDLFDAAGRPVTYDHEGHSTCGRRCFGGGRAAVAGIIDRRWDEVFARAPADREVVFGLVEPKPGQAIRDDRLRSRAQGCLVATIAGDSLGGQVEFMKPEAIARQHPHGVRQLVDGGRWLILAGQPTDDTELALMLARSIVAAGRFEPGAAATAYVRWLDSDPFDIGGTTMAGLQAVRSALARGADPVAAVRERGRTDSLANGAMMRVAPLAVWGHRLAPARLADLARIDAGLTHPNPRVGDANAVYVVALQTALNGGTAADIHRAAVEFAQQTGACAAVRDALAAATREAPADFVSQQGYVMIALQNAFYQLLFAPSLEAGVIDTVRRGGDTDTNAAIAGALLGAAHGLAAVPFPWFDRVITCRSLCDAPTRAPRPRDFWPVDVLKLAERLLWLGEAASGSDGLAARS